MVLMTSWREPTQTSGTQALDAQNPWPGLAAYGEESRAYFHGRKRESAELLRLIRLAPLTVLYGKSGLGKSSLLQAGLFPLLRDEHFLPIYLCLDFASGTLDPLDQLRELLVAAFDRSRVEYPPFAEGEGVWEYLHRPGLELWSEDNFPLTPVLVFDQFEEVFSRGGNDPARTEKVLESLADLIENRIPPRLAEAEALPERARLDVFSQTYRVCLSFREDFLPQIKTWESSVPSLLKNCLRLESMSCTTAIAAIEEAGREVLEPGVASVIVDLVSRDPASEVRSSDVAIEPVLLSLCCTRLNGRRKGRAPISVALVEAEGGGILKGFYEEALADEGVLGAPDVAAFIEEYLIQGNHFRGDYPKDEALTAGLINEAQLGILTGKHRLLRLAPHPDTVRIELIHDRLVPIVGAARAARRLFDSRARTLATGHADHAIQLWDTASGRPQRAALVGHEDAIASLEFSRDDGQLLSASQDGTARLWTLETEQVRVLRGHANSVFAASLSDDGRKVATGSADSTVRLWDAESGQEISRFHGDSVVNFVRFVDGDRHVLSVSWDGTVAKWHGGGHTREVVGLGFVSDGKQLVTASRDGSLRSWTVTTGEQARVLVNGGEPIVAFAQPSGGTNRDRFAFAFRDGRLSFWEVGLEPSEVGAVCCVEGSISDLDFGADGRFLLSASSQGVDVWPADGRGEKRRLLERQPMPVSKVAISSEGEWAAAAAEDGRVWLWHVKDWRAEQPLHAHAGKVFELRFSPDSRSLLTTSQDNSVKVFDLETRKESFSQTNADLVLGGSFLGSDGRVVVSLLSGEVVVWDIAAQLQVSGPPPHAGSVSFDVSRDGRRLATFSWDRSAKVFDTKGWQELATFQHRDLVVGGAVHPRGTYIATAAADGDVRILPVDETEIRRQAELRVARRLTLAECRRYSGSECADLVE